MTDADFEVVYALALDGSNAYAGRRSGLYRLDGDDWQPGYESLDLDSDMATTAVIAAGGLVVAGVEGGLLRSDDGGETWQAFRLPDPPAIVGAFLSLPGSTGDQILLAATLDDGLYHSVDGGQTWRASNIGLYDRHVLCLALLGATVLAGTDTGLYRSGTSGRSWQPLPFAAEPAAISSLCVAPDGTVYAGTEDQGLYRSTDAGQSWVQIGDKAIEGAVNALLADDERLLALVDDRLWQSSDGSASWSLALDDGGITAVALADDGLLYLGFDDGTIKQQHLS